MNVAQPLIQSSLVGEAIDAGPVLVLVADEDMRYVAVNEFACSELGYTREEFLGLTVADVARGPDTRAEYRRLVRSGALAGITTVVHKDGREFRYAYRARETVVAGLTLYVSVGWFEDEPTA